MKKGATLTKADMIIDNKVPGEGQLPTHRTEARNEEREGASK